MADRTPPTALQRLRFSRYRHAVDAARAARISTDTLWRLETGQSWIQPKTLLKIADAWGVDRESLMAAICETYFGA